MTECWKVFIIAVGMDIVELTNTGLCASVEEIGREYVYYTGGIAGITDTVTSQNDAEGIERGPDVVKLYRR